MKIKFNSDDNLSLTKTLEIYNVIIVVRSWDNFRFQPKVCDGCHDLMEKSVYYNDVAIHFWYVSKDKTINLLRNTKLWHYNPNIIKLKDFIIIYVKDG